MSLAVADYSGQAWLQGFNEVGVAIFNMTANELLAIKVSQVQVIDIPWLMCFECYRTGAWLNTMLLCIRPIATPTTFLVEQNKIHIMWVTEFTSNGSLSVSDMLRRKPLGSDMEFRVFNP